CLILWSAGVLDKFWFWTITYASEYGSLLMGAIYSGRWPLARAMHVFANRITEAIDIDWVLWALAGLGLVFGMVDKRSRFTAIFLLALFVFSALAVCQALFFRPHYFIMILPVVALL